MKIIAGLVLSLTLADATASLAQTGRPDAFQNKLVGWVRTITYPTPPSPVTVDTRTYSSAQIGIGRTLIAWMQATYIPIGGLGDLVVSVSEKLGPYNQNTAALPQSYGALARIYTDLRYGANQKIERSSNSHIVWSVMANGFFGEPADALSTPEHYYFTLPTFAQQSFGGEAEEKAVDLSQHPVLGRYPAWFQRNSVNGNRKFVMMTKDGRLPYAALTRGEYLSVLEGAVSRLYATEKAKIQADGNARFVEAAMKALEDKHAKRIAALDRDRAKYRDRLAEPARISTMQPSALLENQPDVFEGSGGSAMSLQVYTFDPQSVSAARSDQPQWIVVSWTAQMTDPASRHLHEAVINKFNFQYVYDYFFASEKVRGQTYAPRP